MKQTPSPSPSEPKTTLLWYRRIRWVRHFFVVGALCSMPLAMIVWAVMGGATDPIAERAVLAKWTIVLGTLASFVCLVFFGLSWLLEQIFDPSFRAQRSEKGGVSPERESVSTPSHGQKEAYDTHEGEAAVKDPAPILGTGQGSKWGVVWFVLGIAGAVAVGLLIERLMQWLVGT